MKVGEGERVHNTSGSKVRLPEDIICQCCSGEFSLLYVSPYLVQETWFQCHMAPSKAGSQSLVFTAKKWSN